MEGLEWRAYPLPRLLFFFILGLLSCAKPLCIILVLPLVLCCKEPRGRLLVLVFVSLGVVRGMDTSPRRTFNSGEVACMGRVISLPTPTKKGFRQDFECFQADTPPVHVRVYLGEEHPFPLGGLFALEGQLVAPRTPTDSTTFNERAYLQSQGIEALMFYPTSGECQGFRQSAKTLLATLRGRLSERLGTSLENTEARGIVAALVLGDKRALGKDTRKRFADTGAIHVLAVSGLHMGLVYAFLGFLLSRLALRFRIARAVFMLLGIWGFAILTGLAPSCTRAAILFSCLALGKAMNRNSNAKNLLAGAALLQLIFLPEDLRNIGFQLSYSAVAGILWFEPMLRFSMKSSWMNWMGGMVRVSVAAQLGTWPLSLFYFGQLPGWFWLSSIAVLPLASSILFLGIAKLCLADLAIGSGISNLLESCTSLMIKWVSLIESLPNGVYTCDSFNLIALTLAYGLVLTFGFFLQKPTHLKFRVCCLIAMALGIQGAMPA